MDYKLSILIPSLISREESLNTLLIELRRQIGDLPVEVWPCVDGGTMDIGSKRNKLLGLAKGEYVCFIDDDDTVSKDYIKLILEGIETGKDCLSLRGVITWNGDNPEIFEHSIRYPAYKTNETGFPKYERYPNHLNVIKASIAKQFKFKEVDHGEDTDWATQIKNSGLIKTEHYIDSVLYHYNYVERKPIDYRDTSNRIEVRELPNVKEYTEDEMIDIALALRPEDRIEMESELRVLQTPKNKSALTAVIKVAINNHKIYSIYQKYEARIKK